MPKRIDWLTILDRFVRQASGHLDPAEVFGHFLAAFEEAFGPRTPVSIHLLDQDTGRLALVASSGLDKARQGRLNLLSLPQLGLEPASEPDQPFSPPGQELRAFFGRSRIMAVPIRSASMLIGFVLLCPPRPVSASGRSFLGAFGHLLGLAIEAAGLIDRMSQDLERIKAYQKELERQVTRAEAADQAKGHFLAEMSQEISGPVEGILNQIELILAGRLEESQRRQLDQVKASAESLLSLLNDIHDLSQAEAGRLELDKEPFDLGELIQEVEADLAGRAEAAGLKLACGLEAGAPTRLLGDGRRLRQVLLSLLDQAIAATPQGRVSLTVEPGWRGEAGAEFRFTINQTDPGSPSQRRTRLRKAFAEGPDLQPGGRGLSGLGLALARHLIRFMGGRLEFKAEPSPGVSFRAHFRLQDRG